MEMKKGYSVYEHDRLELADSMRIERKVYFEEKTADISGLTTLPLEQLRALREEYAAAEQAAFAALQQQAAAWEEQAGMSAFGTVGQGISLLLGNPANWAKIGHFAALAVAAGLFIRTHVLLKRTVYDFIDATK